MNWWSILEISHDSDIKTIKKAYSKLLKTYNPEDDPEGYQKLREAYDSAIRYTKNNKNKGNQESINNSLDKNNINEVEVIEDKDYIAENNLNEGRQIKVKPKLDINENYVEAEAANLNINYQIMQFFNRLNEIYNDLYLRTDSAVWDDLLNSDVVWNAEAFPIIEDGIFNFLTEHPYLPEEIWIKLDNNFTWSKNEIKLYDIYSESMAHEFLENIKKPSKLKYDYIKSINPQVADEYLYERQQAEKALKDKKYEKAYNHIKNADSLFQGDAELLRLKGDYDYNLKHLKEALEHYKSAFEINNSDFSSALHIGIILVSYKEFNEAIPYLSLCLSYNDNNKLALRLISCAYYYNDDFIMAKENFQKLLSFYGNNKIIKKYLKNIEAQLAGKQIRKIIFDRNFIKEEAAEEEINTEKKSKVNSKRNRYMSYTLKYVIRLAVIFIILFVVRHSFGYENSSNYNNKQNNKTYENIDTDEIEVETPENINTEDFKKVEKFVLDSKNNNDVIMNLHNVKPTKYYKISEPFENKQIFSDTELQERGLRDKVESQLYTGLTEDSVVVIFADPKCSDKNGEYKIDGVMCDIDEEIGNEIKNEHASDYEGLEWISNEFIDASQAKKDSNK